MNLSWSKQSRTDGDVSCVSIPVPKICNEHESRKNKTTPSHQIGCYICATLNTQDFEKNKINKALHKYFIFLKKKKT